MHSPEAEVARILADIAGTNPATGTTRYYAHDHLGSTRNLYYAARQTIGTYWYTPYGDLHNQAGVALESLGGAFTGKPWDPDAQLYYFPYRYYHPKNARWLTRDPLGMIDGPNVYAYVRGNPVNLVDPLGLSSKCEREFEACIARAENTYRTELARIERDKKRCKSQSYKWCGGICLGICLITTIGFFKCMAGCMAACIAYSHHRCEYNAAKKLVEAEESRAVMIDECYSEREQCYEDDCK